MRAILLLSLAILAGCVSAKRQDQSVARAALGVAYLRESNAPAAVGALQQAVKLDPRNFAAWERLALAYMAQGALEDSEKAFRRSIRISPDRGEVHNNYGLLLLRMERPEDALGEFEEALQDLSYRSPALVLSNMCFVHDQMGDHDLAIARCTEAINRAPGLCEPYFIRGQSERATDNLDGALEDFETAIQICGEEKPGSYLYAGEVLIELGDRYAGCGYIQEALNRVRRGPLADQARARLREACQ